MSDQLNTASEPAGNDEAYGSASTPPPPPPPPPPKPDQQKPAQSLEENIGAKWFARVGVIVLLLGISFFLKYAFDNNWVSPAIRVLMGVAAGGILLALGEKTRVKYFAYSQLLSGGGLSVMYLSLYAAYDFYHLITQGAAFVAMSLITAAGIGLSIRLDARSLAIMSVLGGVLTPYLVSSGHNNQVVLFVYLIVLDIGVLVASVFKHWRSIQYVSLAGTFMLFSGWYDRYYDFSQLKSTFLFLTIFFLIYSVASVIYNILEKKKSAGPEQVITLILGLLYFSFSYGLLDPEYHKLMGLFAITLAAYYYMGAYLVRISTPDDDNLYAFLAFMSASAGSLAIPLQFEQATITIGWTLEAALLFFLAARLGKKSIAAFGLAIYVLALSRYLFVDITRTPIIATPIINKAFMAAGFLIAASITSAWAFFKSTAVPEKTDDWFNRRHFIVAFVLAANLLAFFAGNREITHYYNGKSQVARDKYYQEQKLTPVQDYKARLEQSDVLNKQLKSNQSRSSIGLSLFWILHAIIILSAGFFVGNKGLRVGGLILLLLAILKLFFYDLWSLGTLYRIISTMSLGIALLSISFIYQKYKAKIMEII
ncbi:DUF2339 domain-containing protein [Candidatus Falkowbacteria bacterium]|nr:DUF2339 domain-containing protein [Candidatus Falkowbacteria bacterium]